MTLEERIVVGKAFAVATTMTPQPVRTKGPPIPCASSLRGSPVARRARAQSQAVLTAHQALLEDVDWKTPARTDLYFLSVTVRVSAAQPLYIQSAHIIPTVRDGPPAPHSFTDVR